MKIQLKFVALKLDHLPDEGADTLVLEEGASLSDALNALKASDETAFLTLVNESSVPVSERAATQLHDGDTLTLFSPIKGG